MNTCVCEREREEKHGIRIYREKHLLNNIEAQLLSGQTDILAVELNKCVHNHKHHNMDSLFSVF